MKRLFTFVELTKKGKNLVANVLIKKEQEVYKCI